jgi:hypothetical protein
MSFHWSSLLTMQIWGFLYMIYVPSLLVVLLRLWSYVLILSIDDLFCHCWFKDLISQDLHVSWS